MSLSRQELLDFLGQARTLNWPKGFVADKKIFETMLDIVASEHLNETQTANAIYWLFRLQNYGDLDQLFRLFVTLTRNSSQRVRSEAVWFLTGWAAIQGVAGHPVVPSATDKNTIDAVNSALNMGIEKQAELRAKAFLDHRDILGATGDN